MKRRDRGKPLLDVLVLGALLIAGSVAARQTTDKAWRLLSDEPPPDPDDPDIRWRKALVWSVASGVAVGATRLLLRKEFARVRGRGRPSAGRSGTSRLLERTSN